MSAIVLADLILVALIGFGAIWAYRHWPGTSLPARKGNGYLPEGFDYARDPDLPR